MEITIKGSVEEIALFARKLQTRQEDTVIPVNGELLAYKVKADTGYKDSSIITAHGLAQKIFTDDCSIQDKEAACSC